MVSNEEISTWLSQERQWDAAKKWMHQQGKMISPATLRRSFQEGGRTARQRLALNLARQYYTLITSTGTAPATDKTPTMRHSIPV